jgi:hypothetical protein
MDFANLTKLPAIGQAILRAIDEGRQWGLTFTSDPQWQGDRDKMAAHAINESTLWSVGHGLWNGLLGIAGIPADLLISFYSQIKLSAALLTIHDIDTTDPAMQPVVLAAAAGVGLAELAGDLGVRASKEAVKRSLMAIPSKVFADINRTLGIKLISKTSEKTLVNVARLIPVLDSLVTAAVNGATMHASGKAILAFVKTWKAP